MIFILVKYEYYCSLKDVMSVYRMGYEGLSMLIFSHCFTLFALSLQGASTDLPLPVLVQVLPLFKTFFAELVAFI